MAQSMILSQSLKQPQQQGYAPRKSAQQNYLPHQLDFLNVDGGTEKHN